MRISFFEDEERPGQFALWQANCDRSLRGKLGQKALRELEAALLALTEKRLVSGVLDDGKDVCAIGALARHKQRDSASFGDTAEYAMEEVGQKLGMPRLVAWKVVEMNDIIIDDYYVTAEGPNQSQYGTLGGYSVRQRFTPEERYKKMLAWVQRELIAS